MRSARQLSTSAKRCAEAVNVAPQKPRRPPSINPDSLSSTLHTLSSIRNHSRRPVPTAYATLLRCAADTSYSRRGHDLSWSIARAACSDAERGGIALGVDALEELFRFERPDTLHSLILHLAEIATPTPAIYRALARYASPYQSLILLHEMLSRGFHPDNAFVGRLIRQSCETSCPRLALDIARTVEDLGQTVDIAHWVVILASSASSQYLDGVLAAWDKTEGVLHDEGVLLSVLDVAARWGRPDLAASTLDRLPGIAVSPQEHHFAPLLEAHIRAGQTPDALRLLTTMRSAGFAPSRKTAEPICSALQTADAIDQAFYELEDMHNAGTPADITAFNAVIEACIRLGDLERARATQMTATDLGVTPDIETYNLILSGCIAKAHRPLGDTILTEMASAGITPNGDTYSRMIELCVSQSTYEDAFYYLEKLKAEGIKPSYETYRLLVRKCATKRDTRWRLVKEELESLGYRLDRHTLAFINSN